MSDQYPRRQVTNPQAWGLPPIPENIPLSLRNTPGVWAAWNAYPRKNRPGKYDKIPCSVAPLPRRGAAGSTRDPDDWGTFDDAWQVYLDGTTETSGVTMLAHRGRIVIDLDGIVTHYDPATGLVSVDDDERWRLARAAPPTYAEVSPSGTGLRLVYDGTLPASWGDLNAGSSGVEVYGGMSPRHTTMTGHRVAGVPEEVRALDADGMDWLAGLYREARGYVELDTSGRVLAGDPDARLPDLDLGALLPAHQVAFMLPDYNLPPVYRALLDHGVDARPHDGVPDRSEALFSTILSLLARGAQPLFIMSVLCASPGACRVALDHRRGREDRAFEHLWAEVVRATRKFNASGAVTVEHQITGESVSIQTRDVSLTTPAPAPTPAAASAPAPSPAPSPVSSNVIPLDPLDLPRPPVTGAPAPAAATIDPPAAPPPPPWPFDPPPGAGDRDTIYRVLHDRADRHDENTPAEELGHWLANLTTWSQGGGGGGGSGLLPKEIRALLTHSAARQGCSVVDVKQHHRQVASEIREYIETWRVDPVTGWGAGANGGDGVGVVAGAADGAGLVDGVAAGRLRALEYPDRTTMGLPYCTEVNLRILIERGLGGRLTWNECSRSLEAWGIPGYQPREGGWHDYDVLYTVIRDHCQRQHMQGIQANLASSIYALATAPGNSYHPFEAGLAARWRPAGAPLYDTGSPDTTGSPGCPVAWSGAGGGSAWDGVPRWQRVADCLPVAPVAGESPEEAKAWRDLLLRRWCISVVAAVFGYDVPGRGSIPPRLILTLSGKGESIGKTTFFRRLAFGNVPGLAGVLFGEGKTIDPHDRDSIHQALMHMVVELGELDATLRRDQPALKAFFSRDVDVYRRPYARGEQKWKRRTAFCATVNSADFLSDLGQNVRYGVIEIPEGSRVDLDEQARVLGENRWEGLWQFWAEVWEWYRAGEHWWLEGEELGRMVERNRMYRADSVVDEMAGLLEGLFDWEGETAGGRAWRDAGDWETRREIAQGEALVEGMAGATVTPMDIKGFLVVVEMEHGGLDPVERKVLRRLAVTRCGQRGGVPVSAVGGRKSRFLFFPPRG